MKQKSKKIIVLSEVDSTNNYANRLILSEAAEEGTVVLARFQNKGKGQQGNSWESEPGKNLLASIILFPEFLPAGKQFLISKAISLAILDFLKPETDQASIKWPNDIYIGKKKIAGILIENSVKGANLYSSIIGIGLNLNQEKFYSGAPNPVSLKQLTGRNYDEEEVISKIWDHFFEYYENLKQVEIDKIDTLYLNNLFRKNEWSLYRKENLQWEARIAGIGEFGQLQLENREGEIEEFMFKEVEFVI